VEIKGKTINEHCYKMKEMESRNHYNNTCHNGGISMRNNRIILCAAIVFLLISALPGLAQRDWWMGRGAFSGLNLTSDQIDKIQELRLEFQKEILQLRTELQIRFTEIRNMYYRGESQAKIYAKQEEVDLLSDEMEKRYMAYQTEIRGLLTDEQKLLFDRWGSIGYGLGPRYPMGLGMGFGPRGRMGLGLGRGYGRGYGRGWNQGWDMGPGWGRSVGRAWRQGWGRGMGRGWRCPWLWNWR
jgi:Spy/CpxP family protein refolding chaperone